MKIPYIVSLSFDLILAVRPVEAQIVRA
jgi:hypothetical protein